MTEEEGGGGSKGQRGKREVKDWLAVLSPAPKCQRPLLTTGHGSGS